MPHETIAVIGSANVDLIMRLPRLPARGETISDGAFSQVFGGKGANAAVAAARAGGRVVFAGCVGDDVYGPEIVKSLAADGIDTTHVAAAPGVPTGTALIFFDQQGENYLAVAPGANDALTPERARELEPLIAEAAILLLQMEIPSATTLALLELARAHGARILFNYAPVRDLDVPIGPAMTGLIVNETEAAALAGCSVSSASEASTAAALLRTRGPEFVVITLGAAGAYVDSGDVQALIPAFPVQPVDTTAAGDTFCGALAVALVEGQPLAQAARFANAASALTVTQAGAQPSIPHRPAINTLLADSM
ncbi:ribokinase [bacterium]|nr:ribokinase [bacterium]